MNIMDPNKCVVEIILNLVKREKKTLVQYNPCAIDHLRSDILRVSVSNFLDLIAKDI